jgi:membrane-bound lytic murein transglycosylase D
MRLGIYLAILFALGPAGRTHAAEAAADDHVAHVFPRPAELEPAIAFWRAIFTQYSKHQVVLHDAVRLDKVYKVLDFRPHVDDGMSDGELASLERIETDLETDRLRATLLRLHAVGPHPESLTAEERRIYDLFADDPAPDRFLAAADEKRLRGQRGLRERFAEGIRVSRRYLPEMERIFRDEGLPLELTRLPLIESCFNLHAYSKVGAAGIWQFMPKTGRLFMRVDNLVDERRDPLASTRAAAQFLGRVHDMLGSWPLAVTAYNHGPDGMARAAEEVGTTDIAAIVRDYHGKAFGFASRNFYVEFLAALDVEREYQKYFGDLPVDPPLRLHEHRLDRPLAIEAAARLARTDRTELAMLNPALSSVVVSGRRAIPSGYRLRLPDAGRNGFESRLAEFSAEERVTRVAAPAPATRGEGRIVHATATARTRAAVRPAVTRHRAARHTVTRGSGSHRRPVAVASLRKGSRAKKAGKVRVGQVLKVGRSAANET